jgi:hypothetical protein
VLADVRVDGRQRIVEQHDRLLAVRGARNRNALLLAARQVDAALADLGLVAGGEQREIGPQTARVEHAVVARLVDLARENDVVAHARVHNPRRLRHVGDAAIDRDATGANRHLVQQQRQHRALATADRANHQAPTSRA